MPEQPGRGLRHAGIQRRDGERLPEPAEQHGIRYEHRSNRVPRRGAPQLQRIAIVADPRPRHPPRRAQHPPRQAASAGAQGPALAGRQIDNERVEGADALDVGERCGVARQQQVVAVVDADPELDIEERATAPAGLRSRFVEGDLMALIGKLDGGGQPGEAGADHMHPARRRGHCNHSSPWRSTSHSFRAFDKLTRMLGSRHPERNSASSIVR